MTLRTLKEVFRDAGRSYSSLAKSDQAISDEKILTSWNGLMLAAFASRSRPRRDYLEIAKRNAVFSSLICKQMVGCCGRGRRPGKIKCVYRRLRELADGLITPFQATGELHYLDEARRLTSLMITEFWEEEDGGFFFHVRRS